MHDLPKLLQELRNTRQEVRNLVVMGMSPDLIPDQIELVKSLERSARAEVRLRLKHLRWLKSQSPA